MEQENLALEVFQKWKKLVEMRTFRPNLELTNKTAIRELSEDGVFPTRQDAQREHDRITRTYGLNK